MGRALVLLAPSLVRAVLTLARALVSQSQVTQVYPPVTLM